MIIKDKICLSVIIPTYSRVKILKQTLDLLADQVFTAGNFEVIIVDDGSVDETKKVLAEFTDQGQIVLKTISLENGGQARARNIGFKMIAAESSVVVLLGDDHFPVNDDFLALHWARHQEMTEDNVVILGKTMWDPKLEITNFMKFLDWSGQQFGQEKASIFNLIRHERNNDFYDFWHFYTSSVSIKVQLLQQFKFAESFYGYGYEDIEFAYRIDQHYQNQGGLKLFYEPAALLYHHHLIQRVNYLAKMGDLVKNARLFESLHPELKVLPQGVKKVLLMVIASRFMPWSWGLFGVMWQNYALLKRQLLVEMAN